MTVDKEHGTTEQKRQRSFRNSEGITQLVHRGINFNSKMFSTFPDQNVLKTKIKCKGSLPTVHAQCCMNA